MSENKVIFRLFLFLFVSIGTISTTKVDQCSANNCQRPCCQCPTSGSQPTSFNTTEIPQLVLLTFVGNLNEEVLNPIRSILNPANRNPNGCPISSTFFVNDNYTDYCFVQRLFDNQNEIAITTANNRCPLTNCYDENNWRPWILDDWQREIRKQRFNILDQGKLHHSHLKGFRVPHLQIDQFRHLPLIRQYHFDYDSSLLFKASNLIWPFTMNHPWDNTDCINCDDETTTIESLWQFPLHEFVHPNTSKSCRTLADASCFPEDQPMTAETIFDLIQFNFNRHVSEELGHRSPFVIELDLFWLAEKKRIRLEGLLRFIEKILASSEHRYVYFVSIAQALEWLKYPRDLSEMMDFWPFNCREILYEYDVDCSNSKILSKNETLAKLIKENETNETTSMPIDRQAEDLFRSGIVLHSIWIFLLLILSVLFYDKYFASK